MGLVNITDAGLSWNELLELTPPASPTFAANTAPIPTRFVIKTTSYGGSAPAKTTPWGWLILAIALAFCLVR